MWLARAMAFVLVAMFGGCSVDGPVVPPPPPADAGPARNPNRPDAGLPVDAATDTCGNVGGACCPQVPACLDEFTTCDDGVCQICGDLAQACCPDGPPCRTGTCDMGVCGA